MQDFYTKSLVSLLALLLSSCLIGYLCFEHTFLHVPLLPTSITSLPWQAESKSDVVQGGASHITLDDDTFSLSFNFTLSHQAQYPNAEVSLVFNKHGQPTLIDLSKYNQLSFSAKCAPSNILMFAAYTFEEKLSVPNDLLTYRAPSTFFSCGEKWSRVELDLTRLETPQWWFDMFKLELSKKEYKLNKVSRLTFNSSFQSPFDVTSKVQLEEITLHGRNWFYMYVFSGFLVIAWSAYAFWFFRLHTQAVMAELRNKIQRDRPLVAYQQLSIEPHRDKDKSTILHFMATRYANADLSLESMAATIGVNRTKINDTLKAELGFTFTGYLNKLRLTEAARLLGEKEEANIAEIAYSVGYKNVSYFNKLFKEEYNCTPKTFKSLCDNAAKDPQ